MKRGFSLIAAVFFIILLSTIALTSLSTATMSVSQTSNIAMREQMAYLANSATEYAVMRMQATDYTKDCFKEATIYYPEKENWFYKADVEVSYLNSDLSTICSGNMASNASSITSDKYAAIVEVDVEINKDSYGKLPLKFSRRTLQIP